MTIAVVIKVNDGYVLASDSATTVAELTPQGQTAVHNIYNNANKIFNLHKGLPISAMTWGQGNVGPASISTLAKDFRARLVDGDAAYKINPEKYTMNEVAQRFKKFFHDEHYAPFAASRKAAGQPTDPLGLSVAGYGANSDQPEIYHLDLSPSGCAGPTELLVGDTGAQWWGQPEAITRLMNGVSQFTPEALKNLSLATDDTEAVKITRDIMGQVAINLVGAPMPIQDAIDLAEFLVQVTIGFVRFSPGHPTVGGPIEIAAVTKHEGFRWVRRKHYFEDKLNPTTERT